MAKIIETNLSIGNYGEILDHQSRVIEVDSWEDYVNEIRNGVSIERNDLYGTLHGRSIQSNVTIENFQSDNHHLECDVQNDRFKSKKLAYLILE